jgi:hypothetical protein
MLPSSWALSSGLGLSLFAYGSFVLHSVIQSIRLSGMTLDATLLNFIMAFAMMAWGLVFNVKGLRQIMSKYPRINRLIVVGAASLSASVVTASLSINNYMQYLEDKADLARCIAQMGFCGRWFPLIYYNDFIIFSIAGGILGVIGAALLFAGWRGRNKHAVIIRKNSS